MLHYVSNCIVFILRLIPYGCVATGKDIGVIEVVRKASTIMKIQSKKGIAGAIQMDSSALHKWIVSHNKDRYGIYLSLSIQSNYNGLVYLLYA